MTPLDIEEIINLHPDDAFRLTLSSGDQIDVPHAGAIRIFDLKVMIFPNLEPGRIYSTGKIQYVSAVNVAMISPMRRPTTPSNN
ncbi:MAG TPA: hypothetical protein VF595_09195 [Tepidisphaeraceae bacterium]